MKVSVILGSGNISIVDYWKDKKVSLSTAWWKRRMDSSFVCATHFRHIVRRQGHEYPVCSSPVFIMAVAEVDEKTMIVQSVDIIDTVSFVWNGSSKKLDPVLVADLKESFAHHEGILFPWLGKEAGQCQDQ